MSGESKNSLNLKPASTVDGISLLVSSCSVPGSMADFKSKGSLVYNMYPYVVECSKLHRERCLVRAHH